MRSFLLSSLVLAALVLSASAQFVYQNTMAILQPPSTIPNSGTYSAVISWETNMKDLVNLHLDLSDITQNYAYDGGVTIQVQGPGAGVANFALKLTGNNGSLNSGDRYQLHTYMTNQTSSTRYGAGNDWMYTVFDYYNAVTVSTAPLANSMSMVSVPTTIPSSGYFVGDVFWSSNIPGYTILHMDLGDVTQGYAYDGGAQMNVSSPGSGILSFNMSITNTVTPGQPLSLGDSYDIHLYMASAANNSLYNGADWQHVAFERYYTAAAAVRTTLANTITVLNPPTLIPPTGNITVQCAWSTNVTGLVNLHLDISDITQNYAYDGGAMVQAMGPGAGVVSITTPISTTGAAADKYQLHAYMLDEITSQEVYTSAGNQDWQYALFNAYYPVTQGIAAVVTYPYFLTAYQAPSTIPNSGVVTLVIEWSSNSQTSTNIHVDLSDITKAYAYDGGVTMTVSSPGTGFIQLSLPIIGQLATGDAYQLHVYETSLANTTQFGSGNDWQHTNYDLYIPVVVSSAPLTNALTMLNVPTQIGATGVLQLEVFYTSNLPNGTVVHVDMEDITQNYALIATSAVQVASPGSGTVTLMITTTAAMKLALGDSYMLHAYMTGINAANTPVSDVYAAVTVATSATIPIQLLPLNTLTTIPNTGNFTVQYKWSCNYTGEINLHVDLSDVTANWQFEAGNTVQVTSPGAGIASFFINIGTAVLPLGDSFSLHSYIAPTSTALLYGFGNDWQHEIYDGFTTVQAVLPSGITVAQNSLTFPSPPSVIPTTGAFTVVVAYTTNYTTGVNIHLDLSDVTQSWLFENGSTIVVPAGQQSGTLTFTLYIAPSTTLNAGDSYDLHAYMAPTVNSNANGGVGNDWKISISDGYAPVTVSGVPLSNTLTVLNPPTTLAIEATEQFQVQWTASYAGLINIHLDCSDVSLAYAWEGGASTQVTGPGSGIAIMYVALNTSMNVGDNFTMHAYMTSVANSTAHGGSGNDWQYTAYDAFYPMTAAKLTTFPNKVSLLNPPTVIPALGKFVIQLAYSTNVNDMDLHVDLSDVTQSWAYDAGTTTTIYAAGSGVISMTLALTSSLPPSDSYMLHVYMSSLANATQFGGSGNDWQHTAYDAFYPVSVSGVSGGSSSSSSLSHGAIAGIVIGSVVGAIILLGLCAFFLAAGRSGKSGKMDDHHATGAHARHEDEVSTTSHNQEMEMGETHTQA